MSPALKSMSSAMNAVVQNVNKIAKATNSLSPAELSRMNSAVKNSGRADGPDDEERVKCILKS